jgi:hypothetical protein
MTHAIAQSSSQAIFWNTWSHRHPDRINALLRRHQSETDVFCLTEVTDIHPEHVKKPGSNLKHNKPAGERPDEPPLQVDSLFNTKTVLDEKFEHFYDSSRRSDWRCEQSFRKFPNVGFGSALFYRKSLKVIMTGSSLVCEHIEDDEIRPRTVQWIVYEKGGVRYLVAHLHGIWIESNTKGDHPARMIQSIQLLDLIELITASYKVDKIVFGGDLNLDITTRALNMLSAEKNQRAGPFRNLIKEFGITDTRTSEYRKYDTPGETKYADYAFVGKNVEVERFEVLNEVLASDHAPLVLSFR